MGQTIFRGSIVLIVIACALTVWWILSDDPQQRVIHPSSGYLLDTI